MKYLAIVLVAVLLLGCQAAPTRQTASVTHQAGDTPQMNSVTVVGIPAINTNAKARAAAEARQRPLRKRGLTTESKPPVDNSEAAKQAKALFLMTSQERLEWTDQLLKRSGIDVRDPE